MNMYKIVKSDSQPLYYLLEIDDDGNQTVLCDNKSLAEVKKHESIAGKNVELVNEEDTRATREAV